MTVCLKIRGVLLSAIRRDLERPHPFAHERVGFIAAALSAAGNGLLILAREYRPVLDEDYLRDRSVGAMMGPDAIRKALQWAMQSGIALFHVHTHGGHGLPSYSSTDLRENAKFVPDFFKVAPDRAHGTLVLSDDAARGQVWLDRMRSPSFIDEFVEVGAPTRRWGTA